MVMGFQDFDDSYYGLRENPKKTWRVSVLEEKGELMTCHSGKRSRVSIESEKTLPGFEVLCPVKKKRSKLRYKVSGFCFVSDFNFNSKFSEFSGEEEAALSLVMLSSGFSNWDDFVSDFDCSEKDSLISKAKILNRKKIELVVDSETTSVELDNKSCSEPVQVDKETNSGKTVFCDKERELGMKLDLFGSKFGDCVPINESEKLLKGDSFYIKVTDNEIEKGNEFKTSEKPGDNTELGVKLTSFGSIFGDLVMRPLKGVDFDIGYLDTVTEKTNMFRTSDLTSFDDHNITEVGTDGFVGMEIGKFGCVISENCENKPEIECGVEIDELGLKSYGNCKNKPEISSCMEVVDFSSKLSENCKNKTESSTKIDELGPKISENCENLPEIKCKTCNKKFLSTQALGGHRSRKCDGKLYEMVTSYEQKKNESTVYEFERGLGIKIDESGSKVPKNCEKEREIKCRICNRSFTSWQGLGGHRSRKCDEETGEMEIGYEQKKTIQAAGNHHSKKCNKKTNKMEASFEQKKNESFHECPTCFKVFPSGQALGGHKRAHFTGYSENKNKESAAGVAGFCFRRQLGSGFGLRPCWAKSDCGPELVGPMVIPNQEIYQV